MADDDGMSEDEIAAFLLEGDRCDPDLRAREKFFNPPTRLELFNPDSGAPASVNGRQAPVGAHSLRLVRPDGQVTLAEKMQQFRETCEHAVEALRQIQKSKPEFRLYNVIDGYSKSEDPRYCTEDTARIVGDALSAELSSISFARQHIDRLVVAVNHHFEKQATATKTKSRKISAEDLNRQFDALQTRIERLCAGDLDMDIIEVRR